MLALRRQLMKNHACLLLFASGTPMMLGGDEFARTQHGNNNAYCQDNEISWFDWDARLDATTTWSSSSARRSRFARRFPVLQRRQFSLGEDLDDDGVPDLTWFGPTMGIPAGTTPRRARCACSSRAAE